MEIGCNLYAGIYPVAAFCTDWEKPIRIEAKPFTDLSRQAVWVSCGSAGNFYRPVWQPATDSEICTDTAFTLDGQSLRIAGSQSVFGAVVCSMPYNQLDYEKYSALECRIFNHGGTSVSLLLTSGEKEGSIQTKTIPAEAGEDLYGGWKKFRFPFDNLPAGQITRMELRFSQPESKIFFVNAEGFVLFPR